MQGTAYTTVNDEPDHSPGIQAPIALPEKISQEKRKARKKHYFCWNKPADLFQVLYYQTGYLPSQSEAPALRSLHLFRASSRRTFSPSSHMRDVAKHHSSFYVYSHQEFRKFGIQCCSIHQMCTCLMEIPHRAVRAYWWSVEKFPRGISIDSVFWSSFIKLRFIVYLNLVDLLLWTSTLVRKRER